MNRTTRQQKDKIIECLKADSYIFPDHDAIEYCEYFKYLLPRVQGEIGCYIKVTTCHVFANEWYITATIRLFLFVGESMVRNYAEIQRVIKTHDDMQRVNELAELVLNNKDLIML